MPGFDDWNTSDLVALGRAGELGSLDTSDRPQLEQMLSGDTLPKADPLEARRTRMQAHIQKYWARLRTQLPGCDGCCTTYGCPDLVVLNCYRGMRHAF